MDQPSLPPAADVPLPGARWGDWRWLLLLLVLTAGLRLWQLTHTELATRDSIGYIRQAWRLEHEPWAKVIRTSAQHPGYAVCIHLASRPVRTMMQADLPRTMQVTAQVVSAAASLLLVFPLFYLGKELFDSRVGFWAALLVQVLPSTGRMMPDGMSEPLFLLLASSAMAAGVRGLHTRRVGWFAVSGLLGGVSYLVRTEGLLVVFATGCVLLAMQRNARWRQPWRKALGQGAGLAGTTALVAVPFMVLIGGVTLKVSLNYMFEREGWVQPAAEKQAAAAAPLPPAIWWIGSDVGPDDRRWWAAGAVLHVLDKSFFHFLWPAALFGLWWFRGRMAERPGRWVPVVLALVLLPLLYRLAQSAGYVGGRHVLLIVVGGLYWSVAGLAAFAAVVSRRAGGPAPLLSGVLLAAGVAVCVPKALATLHGNRTGFREAGQWLAANSKPDDLVLDPLAWTSYHAGRAFSDTRPTFPGDCYVVLEHSENEHQHLEYLISHARNMARWGDPVYTETVRRGKKKARLVIYRLKVRETGEPVARPQPLKL